MLLIKNGSVYTMENDKCEKIDILVNDNGKIEKIGEINEQYDNVIDANGLIVYPGIIEAHCHLGLEEAGIGFEGDDVNEMIDPITPYVRVIDGINILDETVAEANQAGITTVCVAPGSANVIGGEVSILKTVGNSVDKAMIKQKAAIKCAFGENPKRVYKNKKIATRMGTAALLRETLFDAIEYAKKKQYFIKKEELLDLDFKLEPMLDVINKEIPLKVHAHRADDIITAIRIAKEFDIDITLDHCTEGHLIVDEIKESGFPAIVGPTFSHKSKFELKNLTFDTSKILCDAGIKIAITTDSPVIPQKYLPLCAGLAMKNGLSEIEALKAITINPAMILGIDDRVGSLKVRKDADMVICDGNILNSLTNVIYTIVDGKITYKK